MRFSFVIHFSSPVFQFSVVNYSSGNVSRKSVLKKERLREEGQPVFVSCDVFYSVFCIFSNFIWIQLMTTWTAAASIPQFKITSEFIKKEEKGFSEFDCRTEWPLQSSFFLRFYSVWISLTETQKKALEGEKRRKEEVELKLNGITTRRDSDLWSRDSNIKNQATK